MSEQKALHIIVHGRVQGVGFRYYTQQNATQAGVVGWVRNKMDGTVEIWAEGTDKQLQQLVSAVRQGPRSSWVDRLEQGWRAPKGKFNSFRIRY